MNLRAATTSILVFITFCTTNARDQSLTNFFRSRAGDFRRTRISDQVSGPLLRTIYSRSPSLRAQSRLPYLPSTILFPDRNLALSSAGPSSGNLFSRFASITFPGSPFSRPRSRNEGESEDKSSKNSNLQTRVSNQSAGQWNYYNWWRAYIKYCYNRRSVITTTVPVASGTTPSFTRTPSDDDDDEKDNQTTLSSLLTQSTTTAQSVSTAASSSTTESTTNPSVSTTVAVDDDDDEPDQTASSLSSQKTTAPATSTPASSSSTQSSTTFVTTTASVDDDDDEDDTSQATQPSTPSQSTTPSPAPITSELTFVTVSDNPSDPIDGLFLPDSEALQENLIRDFIGANDRNTL